MTASAYEIGEVAWRSKWRARGEVIREEARLRKAAPRPRTPGEVRDKTGKTRCTELQVQ